MPASKAAGDRAAAYVLYADPRVTNGQPVDVTAVNARQLMSPDDLAKLSVGDAVAVSGRSLGNPLLRALDFVATMLPLVVGPEPSADLRPRRPATNPAAAAARAAADDEAGTQRVLLGTVQAARDGLRDNPVVDVLVQTPDGLTAVVVLDRSVLTPAGEEQLRDGTFTVLGKVTAVLGTDDHVNLFRRTSIAATGVEASRDMVAELIAAGVDVEVSDPVVQGPAVQIHPVAVLL